MTVRTVVAQVGAVIGAAAALSLVIVLWSPIGRQVLGLSVAAPFGLRDDVFALGLSAPAIVYKALADVEYATVGWVDWCDNRILRGRLGNIPPIAYEPPATLLSVESSDPHGCGRHPGALHRPAAGACSWLGRD